MVATILKDLIVEKSSLIVCPFYHCDAILCDARTEMKQYGRCPISQSVFMIATILTDLVVEKEAYVTT